MLSLIIFLGYGLLTIWIHEIGHYWKARKEGIYKGWGVLPNPHIKLTQPFRSRWGYLSGLMFSFITAPGWIIGWGWDFLWIFLVYAFACAGADIFCFMFYGRVKEAWEKKNSV